MIHNKGLKFAAAALTALMMLITPLQAYAEDAVPAGTAEETLTSGEEGSFAEFAGTDVTAASVSDADAKEALNRAVSYLDAHSGNLTVGTEGGEWSLIVLARNSTLDKEAKNTYMKNLAATLDSMGGKLSGVKYTEYSRVTLALSALGLDPRSVGSYDVLQPLADFSKVTIQGINGPIWALIAFDSGNYEIPVLSAGAKGEQISRDGIIRYLLDHQYTAPDGTKGGWSFSGRGLDDICPMAVQALAPYYSTDPEVRAAVDLALQLWSEKQTADGGFGDEANSGNGGSEAISQTIVALSALNPELVRSAQFTKNGNTLLDALLAYQAADGSFCHTIGDGGGNAIATDQSALALTAYIRALEGKTRLYDMTDVPAQNTDEVPAEEVAALKAGLAAVPYHPVVDDKDALLAVEGRLAQTGSFEGKAGMAARIAELKAKIAGQEAVLAAWDADMWKITPSEVTESDREALEDLRARYNALPAANRKHLQYARDLIDAEAHLLGLGRSGKPLWGNQKVQSPDKDRPSRKPGNRYHTSVESNTVTAKIEDGIVSAGEFQEAKDLERILRIESRLETGKQYVMTIAGEDITEVFEMKAGIRTDSEYTEQIRRLAEDPFIFRFEQKGTFPGPMQVELPTTLEDGTYLLLRYNAEEKKAEAPVKITIEKGIATFMADEGGHYMIAQKVHSKSLDELDAETPAEPDITPEDVPDPEAEADFDEVLAGTASSVNYWLAALCVLLAAALAAAVFLLVKKGKGNK